MVKNDRIEGKVSSEVRREFEVMVAELSFDLRKKLRRRVVFEDVIQLILDVYHKQPWAFKEAVVAKPRIK